MPHAAPQKFHSIKGLSDQRRLPRLGKIRQGIKMTGPNGSYPVETPHFVVPPEVERVYGPQPTSLKILLPLNSRSDIFPQAYKWYSRQGLKCKGNGETATRRWADCNADLRTFIGGTHKPGDLVEVPCPCPLLQSKDCGPVGHLLVMLPEVSVSGIYQIDVTSQTSLVELNSAIDLTGNLLGRIAMVPFTLRRTPYTMMVDGTSRTHYLLQLTYDGNIDDARAIRATQQSLPTLALPEPTDEPITLSPPPDSETSSNLLNEDERPDSQPITTSTPAPTTLPVPNATHPTPPAPASEPEPPRQEPPTRQPSTSTAADAAGSTQSPQLTCPCGKTISPAIARYSTKRWGTPLCFGCQRKTKSQRRAS